MLGFLGVRLMQSVPVLIVMSFITFVIIQAPPGDYGDFIRTNMMVQGGASAEAATAAANEYRETHGLNDPMIVQYFRWIWGIVSRGDFGQSYAYNKPVAEILAQRLPPTIAIALICHFLATVIGISFGILAATRQYTWVDTVLSFVAFMGMTIPRFLLALIILYVLVFQLNVQEIGSFYSSRYGGQPYWEGFLDFNWGKLWNLIQHIWPVIAVAAFGGLAYNMRVMRANLLDTLNAQYIETARAKGLSEGRVLYGHVFRNAMLIVIAGFPGLFLAVFFGSSLLIEVIFSLDGLGQLGFRSAVERDYPIIFGTLFAFGLIGLVVGILSDLMYVFVDPRIDFERRE
mgnify:CR=1 FL=1